MRYFIAALWVLGALILPNKVEALDCPWPIFRLADGVDATQEKQRYDTEARLRLEFLERTPIIFRGRIASMRYLTDPRRMNTSLLVFDHVEILKGRLPTTDRKAFVIKQEWCDFSCNVKLARMAWPRGKTVVVGAHYNHFVDPSKAVDSFSKRIIYKGRIDAVLGVCDSGELAPLALELLNAPDAEISRLKREYLPLRAQ